MQSPVSLTKMTALQEQGSLCLMLAQCAAQETALEIVAVMSPMWLQSRNDTINIYYNVSNAVSCDQETTLETLQQLSPMGSTRKNIGDSCWGMATNTP